MRLEEYIKTNKIKVKDFIRHIKRFKDFRTFNYMSFKRYKDGITTPPLKFILLVKNITNNQFDYEDWINKK